MKIRLGKDKFKLKKSNTLVGLKTAKSRSTESTTPKSLNEQQKKYTRLGGFQIFDIGNANNADKELDSLREADEVEVGTHVYVDEDGQTPFVPNGDIYITFAERVDAEEQAIVLDEFNLELIKQRSESQIRARVTAKSMNPIKVAYFLEKVSLVETAKADMDSILKEYDNVGTPQEHLFKYQWHIKNTGVIPDSMPVHHINPNAEAKVIDAWNRLGNKGSEDITIAVIDMGFDLEHPDLNSRIVDAWDVWDNEPFAQPKTFRDHGTPCAGVALARENGFGTVGVAPNSKFMPISGLGFSIRDTEVMFDHCVDKGADIISCSWGSIKPEHELDATKEDIIRKAATKGRDGKGCVILFAAGNENREVTNVYGRHPDVICVGASTSQDVHASYSNRGFEVDIVAPSNGDWPLIAPKASWDSGHWFDGNNLDSQYKHFGGTSAATPLVAGVCALMLTANPNLTAKEVKNILIQTADKIGHPTEYVNGHSRRYGYGRVNADKAVAEAIRLLDSGETKVEVEPAVASGRGLFRFSVSRQPSIGFGVQVGVYAEYGNVLIQVEKLQKAFERHPAVVNINELGGRTVYKVLLGQFRDVSEARKMLNFMKTKGFNGFVADYKRLK
ncbi:MAG: S8 family serine peptidase [Saprospiraceae bacterium]